MEINPTTTQIHNLGYFRHKQLELHYCEYGEGSNIQIAFHGFGQDKFYIKPLADSIPENTKMISFDLPFHGNSHWHAGDSIMRKGLFIEALHAFFESRNISRFVLIGFSMGGKFALVILKYFPKRIEKLILIAPDGIKSSFWYALATHSLVSKTLFKHTIVKPTIFNLMVSAVYKMNLLDNGLLKFTKQQMNTRAKRRQVYFSWVVFRKLKVKKEEIVNVLNSSSIRLTIFLGKYDKMIDKTSMYLFAQKLNSVEIIELESGHSNMLQSVANYFHTSTDYVNVINKQTI